MFSKIANWAYSLFNQTVYGVKSRADFYTEAARDSKWRSFRKVQLVNKKCAICDGTEGLELHHKKSFHDSPELELDPDNVMVLCDNHPRNCHFIFGHLMNWRFINDDIDNTVEYFQLLRKKAKMKASRSNNDLRS